MSIKYQLTNERDHWSSETGDLQIWETAPDTLNLVFRGVSDDEFIGPLLKRLDAGLTNGATTFFIDWEKMTGFSPAMRSELTKFVIANAQSYENVYILVMLATVKLGIRLVNAALKKEFIVYDNRSDFEQKQREHLER